MNDHEAPECRAAREALSAVIDHEDAGVGMPWLTEHLVGCPGCRAWYADAQEVRRRTRLAPTPPVPPLRAMIQAAVQRQPSTPPLPARVRAELPRVVLVVAALLLLWFSAPALLLGRDPDTGMHPAHELGSFEVALALSLLLCAARPRLARTTAWIVGVVALLLVTTALVDLAHPGRTTWGDEAPHLLWLLAFLALITTSRLSPSAASQLPVSTADDHPTPHRLLPRAASAHPTQAEGGSSSATHRSA